MIRKIIREITLFIFSMGLIIYVLVYCFSLLLIDFFMGTKIVELMFFIQKAIDCAIQNTGMYIIEKLEKKDMWY